MAKKTNKTPAPAPDNEHDPEYHMICLLEKEEFILDANPLKAPKDSCEGNGRDRTIMFRQGLYSKKQELKVVIGPKWTTVYFLEQPGEIKDIDSAKTNNPLAVINLVDSMTPNFLRPDDAA